MAYKKPININPLSIRLPITAIVSISHRISGVFIFLLIPALLWLLQNSLASQQSFDQLHSIFGHWCAKSVIFVLLASLIFHIIAGVRHLFMDMHIGESLVGARLTSWFVFLSSGVLIGATAMWLWG